MDLGFSMCQTKRMKRFSQAFFLCLLPLLSLSSFAYSNDAPIVEELADELQRLRKMSQRLELAIPNPIQETSKESTPKLATEFVEDEISTGQAAPIRRFESSGEDRRPLQKDDLQLESTSLDGLENRHSEGENRYRARRERSRR